MPRAALALMCQDPHVAEAMATVGQACPYGEVEQVSAIPPPPPVHLLPARKKKKSRFATCGPEEGRFGSQRGHRAWRRCPAARRGLHGAALTRPQGPTVKRRAFGTGHSGRSGKEDNHMRMMWGIMISLGVLSAAPAVAGEFANGQGYNNIWSSAQGTSNSYGNAKAMSGSNATSSATGGGGLVGTFSSVGGVTSSTTSMAMTKSNGNGYAQSQSSGYAGGNASASGAAGRGH